MLVENLSVPFDRRVRQESTALAAAGYKVTVVCPVGVGRDQALEDTFDDVRVLRYPLRPATGGAAGYLREYSIALWQTARLALAVSRDCRVDVVHACNPPDLLFLVALLLRPQGAVFVYDQHDLVPELFLSRFARHGRALYWLTRIAEKLTYALSDAVISPNESYRKIALERGKVSPDRVGVVRSAPDLSKFGPSEPDSSLRQGKPYLAAYLGVMGPQDGVDYALRSIAYLRAVIGRDDVHYIFMGAGDAFDDMVALSKDLGLVDIVEFTGRVSDEFVQRCLSTADVCLSPDPPNPLNSVSTMNKVVEYMAMARPIVSFDLAEARVSADTSAVFVENCDESGFAQAIDDLLRDPGRRHDMGQVGRDRVERALSWDVSRKNLLDFYASVVGRLVARHL